MKNRWGKILYCALGICAMIGTLGLVFVLTYALYSLGGETQHQTPMTERVISAPHGACMVIDRDGRQVPVLVSRPSGVGLNKPFGVIERGLPTLWVEQVTAWDVAEPGPEPAQEQKWVECLKQFALRK